MSTDIQSVIKNFLNVTTKIPQKIALRVSLMIKTFDRKNCASMALSNNISYSKVYINKKEAPDLIDGCTKFLHGLIQNIATKENPGYLIVDFTLILKQFSQYIPYVTYDYDGVRKYISKGLSAGFIFWSNGKILIPFDFDFWLRKKDAGELYRKKSKIVKELVRLAKSRGIPFSEIKLDGAFASVEMMKFFESEGIDYTMRIPSNRVVKTELSTNNLSEHPELKLNRNQKFKTISAYYKGIPCYITAHKRKGPRGMKQVVFIVIA